MAKNRIRQKENRKKKYAEEILDSLDSFGNRDKTPQEAVENIIRKERRSKNEIQQLANCSLMKNKEEKLWIMCWRK